MKINLFKPFDQFWIPNIQALQQDKPLKFDAFKAVTARKTGKTWINMHMVILSVLIELSKNKTVHCYFVRNSKNMLLNTMTEFCNYFQEMDPSFETYQHFNKTGLEINFKGFKATGHIINPITNPTPTLGLANSRADLIIIFADERSQLDPKLYQHLLFSIRSDKPNHQKLRIEIANPDGRDTQWSQSIFTELNLPMDKDQLAIAEPRLYTTKTKGKTFYMHSQCFANPFLTPQEKQEFKASLIENPYLSNMTVYGIPQALNGSVYDNLSIMELTDDVLSEEFNQLLIGVDIGYTDTEGNGGSTCVQVGLYSKRSGVVFIDGYRHNNANDLKPTQKVFNDVYNFIKQSYITYSQFSSVKTVKIYVDETGAATWLETKRLNDPDEMVNHYVFRSTKDINKNGWPNQNRGVDVNNWIALGLFRVLPTNTWLLDDLKNCVWLKAKTQSETGNDKVIRWHKYTDNLNAMEYAMWDIRRLIDDLAKLNAKWRSETNG